MNTAEESALARGREVVPHGPSKTRTSASANTRQPRLRSLGAEFNEDHHGVYLEALKNAIENEPDMRNIAVTGAYGTGKSSVLSEVAKLYPGRVLELSLSTVGSDQVEAPPDAGGEPGTEINPASTTITNRIQKEIVKQILYRDAPWKTPGSRFRRLSRFRSVPAAVNGAALAAIFLLLLFQSGATKPLVAIAGGHALSTVAIYVAIYIILAIAVFKTRQFMHDRIFVEKLAAGPATVSLGTQSSSYFDQYVDEIVYHFEESGRDIVIFEDIDRFEDVQIFETLRALNTLLNGAEQVRFRKGHSARWFKRFRPITPDVKFIYALRDSVFEKLGTETEESALSDAAAEEIKQANRTKFFDLVIPIVPFITYRNARDLMSDEMEGTDVSRTLTNLAARHLADKRLIVNMRNEYDIFANRLLAHPTPVPDLDPDRLFAMILYKSAHMADFEAIRLGTSRLDDLHESWRKLVEGCIDDLTADRRDVTLRISRHDAIEARSEKLGQRLQVISKVMVPAGHEQQTQLTVAGQTYDYRKFSDVDLWRSITTHKKPVSIFLPSRGAVTLSYANLATLLCEDLDAKRWQREDRTQLLRRRDLLTDKVRFLRRHTWQEIFDRPEFTALIFPEGEAESFRQLVERLLNSKLAYNLVAQGFINDYFALYISMYYGRHLRRDALNFIIRALDRGETHMLYPLDPEDVDAILTDKGEHILQDRSSYNISIMDHLLESSPIRTSALIENIAAWNQIDQDFTTRYLANGRYDEKFITLLAPLQENILVYLTSSTQVDDTSRIRLVNAAIAHFDSDRDYIWNEEVVTFLQDNYTEFSVLIGDVPTPQTARAMEVLAKLDIRLPSIAQLNEQACQSAISGETYITNEGNLQKLTGSPSIALNDIYDVDQRIYTTTLSRLPAYIESVANASPIQYTVTSVEYFTDILQDVDNAVSGDVESFQHLVRLAEKNCRVEILTEAPVKAWPALADDCRISPTATNILAYLNELGEVDEYLARLLKDSEKIGKTEVVKSADRSRLATAIINSGAHLSSAQRARLAASLGLEGYLDPNQMNPESGQLAGLLIELNVIADDIGTFDSTLIDNWETRQFAIEKSKNFEKFVNPDVLPADNLTSLFHSSRMRDSLKDAVLDRAQEFLTQANTEACNAASQHAIRRRIELNLSQLQLLCAKETRRSLLVELIATSDKLSKEDLQNMLRSLGEPYSIISDHGRKRPRLPDDNAHRTIIQRMQELGVVSKFQKEKGQLRVYLNHG